MPHLNKLGLLIVTLLSSVAWAEDETGILDVYYANRLIAQTLVTYNDQAVHFDSPKDLTPHLPVLKRNQFMMEALVGSIPIATSAQACQRNTPANCFATDSETVMAILDRANFRLDLIINPRLMPQGVIESTYITIPKAPLTLTGRAQLQQRVQKSHGALTEQGMSLSVQQTLGNGATRAINTLIADDAGHVESSLYVLRDERHVQLKAGQFESTGSGLLASQAVEGVSISRSFLLQSNLTQMAGTPISLFIPERARVDVLKNNIVYSSRFYEAGNQTIDVSDLPEGTYPVVVRTLIGGQVTSSQQFFFTKSSRIPPVGSWTGSVIYGRLANVDTVYQGEPFSEAHISWRPIDNYVLSAQAQQFENLKRQAIQFERFGSYLDWLAQAIKGNDGSLAGLIRGNVKMGQFGSANLEYLKAKKPITGFSSSSLGTTSNIGNQPINLDITEQFRARLQTSIRRLQVIAEFISAKGPNPFEQRSLSLNYSFRKRWKGTTLSLQSIDHEHEGRLIQLSASIPLGRLYDNEFRLRTQFSNQESQRQLVELDIQGDTSFERLNATSQYQVIAGSTENQQRLFTSSTLRGNHGRFLASVNATQDEATSANGYFLLDTGYTVNRHGTMFYNPENGSSGFIAKVLSSEPRAVTLNVDKQQRKLVLGQQLISTTPYKPITVSLKPAAGEPFNVKDPERVLTTVPGLIPIVEWRTYTVVSAFGSLSKALATGIWRVKSRHSVDQGKPGDFLIIELDDDERELMLEGSNGEQCLIAIPEREQNSVVLNLGELHCPS